MYSCSNTPTGNMFMHRSSGTTKAKPSNSVKALFQALQHGPLKRKDLETTMLTVNERTAHYSGYNASTLAWHVSNGRIIREAGKYALSFKGMLYGYQRGLF
jgi:hypothetical protein